MTTPRCLLAPVLGLSRAGSLVTIPTGATITVKAAPSPSGFVEVLWDSMIIRVFMYDLHATISLKS